jgi:hypothetical protein
MLPLSTSTISLKMNTILASLETSIALSEGFDELKVGLPVSPVVKLKDMPAEELLELSLNAAESTTIVYSIFASKSEVGLMVI